MKLSGRSLNMVGVLDGEYAYKGPDCAQIDLTNNCNNNCVACWCNSPLLGEKVIPPHIKKQSLDYNLVIKLIDTLSRMQTRELYFSGGGEPLMHPNAIEILSYAKSKGFICYLHTNFTLVDDDTLKRIIEMKLDFLVVSLWAATAQTYVKTHPGRTTEDFLRTKEMLARLNKEKKFYPNVRIYNVISNLNYREIVQMVEFCLETCSENTEFTVVDTIPEATDKLLFTKEQVSEILEMCELIKGNKKFYNNGSLIVSNFEHFIRRISNDGNSNVEYDVGVLADIPCYIGWIFARVLADGNVNSCLKSHRIPIGNLYKEEFEAIWNGSKQREFRRCALKPKKDSQIFSMIGNDPKKTIGCYKGCDDLYRNMQMRESFSSLSPSRKSYLHFVTMLKRLERIFLG